MSRAKIAIILGRMNPFTLGHGHLYQEAQKVAPSILTLFGSARSPRNIKNPFTVAERWNFVKCSTSELELTVPLYAMGIRDYVYDNENWLLDVVRAVKSFGYKPEETVVVGHKKDYTSEYLDWLGDVGFKNTHLVDRAFDVDATTIRNHMFDPSLNFSDVEHLVPANVSKMLRGSRHEPWFNNLVEEMQFVNDYKKAWASAPYAPTFVTTDAVVYCGGHILLLERGGNPGKGQLALPGGFLNPRETVFSCCVRELYEETNIKVPEKVMNGSLVGSKVFDAPDRSLRGRTVDHAFYFILKPNPDGTLPKVKGGDDGVSPRWVPLDEISKMCLYEDHLDIIESRFGIQSRSSLDILR